MTDRWAVWLARSVEIPSAMRLPAEIASLVLILTARAAAQPAMATPVPPAAPGPGAPAASPPMSMPAPPPPTAAPDDDVRDEGTALALSIGGTVGSWTMLLAGAGLGSSPTVELAGISALITPGLGHWYADDPLNGWLALRVAALVPVLYAASSSCEDECSGMAGLGYLSLALYAIGTIGDIATSPAAARRHNEQRRALRHVVVAPMAARHVGGVVVGAQF